MGISTPGGLTVANSSPGTTLSLGINPPSASDILVGVALSNASASVSSMTDTAGNTYRQLSAQTNGTSIRTELWQAQNIVGGSSTWNVNVSAASLISAALVVYQGTADAGTPPPQNTNNATGSSNLSQVSVVTHDNNDWVVAAVGYASSSGDNVTASGGSNVRQAIATSGATGAGIALVDQAQATAGSLSVAASISASRVWATAGAELRIAGASGGGGSGAVNYNDTTPAAPSGTINVKWQADPPTSNPRNASAYLPVMTGDSGSGGKSGAVPAPPSGSAAAGDFLRADGTWAVPAGSGGGGTPNGSMVVGFVVGNGAVGTNVGPILAAPGTGNLSKCIVTTKASDGATGLAFLIKRNGTSVFTSNPTVAAGRPSGSIDTFTNLTGSPIAVAANDLFTIDIAGGSSNWQFIAQLET